MDESNCPRKLTIEDYDRFFTFSLDILSVIGLDGCILSVNPSIERILGFKQQDVLGKPFVEFVHPDDRQVSIAEFKKLRVGVPIVQFENRYLCNDGSYRWLAWIAVPDGSSGLAYAIGRDMTERKRAEEIIGKSHERLLQLTAVSSAVIYSIEAEPALEGPFPVTFVSENIKYVFGYEREEWLADPNWWRSHIHPADLPLILARMSALFEHDRLEREYRFQNKAGTYQWVHDRLRLIRDPSGKPLEIVGSMMDITDLKQAEAERQQLAREQIARLEAETRAAQLESIIEAVPDGVVVVDRRGNVTAVNNALLALLGLAERREALRPLVEYPELVEILTLDGRPFTMEGWGLLRALREETVSLAEARLRLRDGTERFVQANATPVVNEQCEVEQAVAVVRDVTQQRRWELHREVLSCVGQALSQGLNMEAILQTVADQTLQALGADAVGIFLAQPELQELDIAAYRNLRPESVELLSHMRFDATLVSARAFVTNEIQVLEDVSKADVNFVAARGVTELEGIKSIVSVPLRAGTKAVGSLTLATHTRRHFSPEDLETITQVAGMFGMAIENARLYEDSQKREAELDATVNSIADGVVIYSPTGGIARLNPVAQHILGYLPEAYEVPVAERMRLLRAEAADGRPLELAEFPPWRALHGEIVRDFVMIIHRPPNRIVWLSVSAGPILTADGHLVGAVATFSDITERKRVEAEHDRLLAEVQRHADEMDALIDSVAEGVMIVDAQGLILRTNQAARHILGLQRPEDVPKSIADVPAGRVLRLDGSPLPREEWPLIRVLRGETFSQHESIWVGPEGSQRNILGAGSAVFDDKGHLVLGVSVFRDITPIRELERQREEFISVVAHDLRGAMTTIRGYADFLMRPATRQGLPERFQRTLEVISSTSRRMERMISDLLDVSRIEARRLKLVKTRLEIPSFVQDVVRRSGELTKGRSVRVEASGGISRIEADPDRIEQVLANLLANAAKYSYPDTEIVVEVTRLPREAVVSVTNLGPGVFADDREKIFIRFHRTRIAREREASGLGLGLYIAKGLVEAHGGRIWVESEPAEYARFCFALPIAT